MTDKPSPQLPQDPGYWDQLAHKMSADASSPLAGYASSVIHVEGWYDVVARRAASVVAASMAAVLLLWFAYPPSEPSVAQQWIEHSLAPNEVAGSLLVGPQPPSVDSLVVHFPAALDKRGPQ